MQKNLRDKKFKKDIFGKPTQNYRIFIKKKRGVGEGMEEN